MFGGKLGLPEILILLAIALLIWGPGRLAELGKSMGEGIKNFKTAVKDGDKEPERSSAAPLSHPCLIPAFPFFLDNLRGSCAPGACGPPAAPAGRPR